MDFIWSYRIADFVQCLLALQKITGLMDFIRSGGLCIIFTSLAEFVGLMDFIRSGVLSIISTGLSIFYRFYGLYKVWRRL